MRSLPLSSRAGAGELINSSTTAALSRGPTRTSTLSSPTLVTGFGSPACLGFSEIFDIVSALESAEGKGTNFCTHCSFLTSLYIQLTSLGSTDSFLNTTKSADEKALSKAYRKRSLELQCVISAPASRTLLTGRVYSPDKNPNNKKVADRFARLGVINAILRDSEKRKRCVPFSSRSLPTY